MIVFEYKENQLHCEEVPLADLAANYGTPLFVYSASLIAARFREYQEALRKSKVHICYAVKANPNLSLLSLLHDLGAHFDVVSGGELRRVLAVGVPPARIFFAGVGKSLEELRFAIRHSIGSITVESPAEAARVLTLAQELKACPRVAVRINPNIRVRTHPNIRTGGAEHKFGMEENQAYEVATLLHGSPHAELCGISCHLGSQLLDVKPFWAAARRMRACYDRLQTTGCALSFISLGGGFGIAYKDHEKRLVPTELTSLGNAFADIPVTLHLEPGRSLTAEAGVLLTRVEYLKYMPSRNFVVVDAAMNDLLRPVLYDAYHRIQAVAPRVAEPPHTVDVVGPVCETGDFLARDRSLAVRAGDLLAIMDCGAYGAAMSSNYNSRARAAEVLVRNAAAVCIRARETHEQHMQPEKPVRTLKE